jgi:hypothetical protein
MSAYDNDPRVRQITDDQFVVYGDDKYDVYADTPTLWLTGPAIGSQSAHNAGMRNRYEAEAWAEATTRGPFTSADEAIHSLIGDPQ